MSALFPRLLHRTKTSSRTAVLTDALALIAAHRITGGWNSSLGCRIISHTSPNEPTSERTRGIGFQPTGEGKQGRHLPYRTCSTRCRRCRTICRPCEETSRRAGTGCASGVMAFFVSQDGVIYQKDLGKKTEALGETMQKYNPDSTWRKAEEELTQTASGQER